MLSCFLRDLRVLLGKLAVGNERTIPKRCHPRMFLIGGPVPGSLDSRLKYAGMTDPFSFSVGELMNHSVVDTGNPE